MAGSKIRKGDDVIVTTGKNRNARGTVARVLENGKVLVEGVNLAKHHERGNPQAGTAGGIIEKEMPLHISNVALFNPMSNKADRIGFKTLDDGRKVRFFKSDGEVVDI
ncbi:MAG: large subunit ribosomal protein L24 [Gammaproteobacteria bacterium]|jgi:large subunit ribosomal protein L24